MCPCYPCYVLPVRKYGACSHPTRRPLVRKTMKYVTLFLHPPLTPTAYSIRLRSSPPTYVHCIQTYRHTDRLSHFRRRSAGNQCICDSKSNLELFLRDSTDMHVEKHKETSLHCSIESWQCITLQMQKVQARINVVTTRRRKGIKDLKGTDDVGASACLERVFRQ